MFFVQIISRNMKDVISENFLPNQGHESLTRLSPKKLFIHNTEQITRLTEQRTQAATLTIPKSLSHHVTCQLVALK